MNANLPYAIELVIASGALYGLYVLLFERRLPHRWARAYLVAMLAVAAVLPAMEIPVWATEGSFVAVGAIENATLTTLLEPLENVGFSWRAAANVIWLAGTAAMLLSMALQLLSLHRLRRDSRIERLDGYSVVRTDKRIVPFSFGRTIYIPESLPAGEMDAVIAHELSHISHRHTAERMAVEIIKAAMWWNPFAWLTARKLTEVEEYEADGDVIRGGYDKRGYMEILFRCQTGFNPQIANSLNHSITQKRIIMMTRNMSRYARLRLLATLPVVALLLVAFAFTARAAEPAGQTTNALPGIELGEAMPQPEEMPEFQGSSASNFRQWMMMNVRYPDRAVKKGIEGRVVVKFVVEADGSVSNVEILESPHRLLSDEVVRLFGNSPRWTPGRQNGKEVRTSFVLPLDFKL